MKIDNAVAARKAVRAARPRSGTAEAESRAVQYVLNRFDVSPSLAQTIADLAMLGGAP